MFLTFDEYAERGGTLDADTFAALERRASALLNLATHNRVKGETPARESVKSAVFALVQALAREAASADSISIGVSSISNDGMKVTYANRASIERYWKARAREVLAEYLADETVMIDGHITPLLYGGIEYDVNSDGIKEVCNHG